MSENRTHETLSLDFSATIKAHCDNNLMKFYKKYQDQLQMSHGTFYRLVNNKPAYIKNIEAVERLCKAIGLTSGINDPYIQSGYLKTLIQRFERADKACGKGNTEEIQVSILSLFAYYRENKDKFYAIIEKMNEKF